MKRCKPPERHSTFDKQLTTKFRMKHVIPKQENRYPGVEEQEALDLLPNPSRMHDKTDKDKWFTTGLKTKNNLSRGVRKLFVVFHVLEPVVFVVKGGEDGSIKKKRAARETCTNLFEHSDNQICTRIRSTIVWGAKGREWHQ